MERKSPDRSSPDPILEQDFDLNMSVAVASGHVPNMPGPVGGVNKRYRPAPAKTFQCRGYGDCRMVFSRSEHLARHIRKHTGERPFTCHCGKQFSRLDNLRQHAQTVHADKQEQNERMMRDLTSLHATMAAANKAGHPRGARRTSGATAPQQSSNTPASNDVNGMGIIKQEELSLGMHQRPDTSTGYEGDHNGIVYQTSANWHIQTSNMEPPRPSSRSASTTSAASNGGSHSFRDSSQSFLVPPASTSSTSASSQSFLGFPSSLGFNIPSDGSARPTSSGRPPTANADPSQPRSLPPLAAVVSASIPAQSSHQQLYASSPSSTSQSSLHQQQQQHLLSFPIPPVRRPGTGGNRPGTAPASSALYHPAVSHNSGAATKSSYYGGTGLGGAQLQLPYSRGYAADLGAGSGYDSASAGAESSDASPFFFQPPDASASPPLSHNSSRPYPAPPSSSGGAGEYDYGSDSRPQSRRLSVMELCNDDRNGASAGVSAGAFLLSGAGGASRPSTSSSALAALALTDRERSPSSASSASSSSPTSPLSARAGAGEVRAYATGADAGGGRGAAQEFHAGDGAGYGYGGAPGGRVSPANRRVPPPPAAAAGAAGGAVFRGFAPTHSPSPAPYSPQSAQPYSPTGAYGGFLPSPTFSTASASSYGGAGGDGGGASPFSPRSPSFVPQSPAVAAAAAAYGQQEVQYGHGHGDGGGQVRGGLRVGGHGHGHGNGNGAGNGHGYGHARSYGMKV